MTERSSQHIGIVGCSAEGAALCFRTICVEGSALLGPHAHPELSLHTHALADYVRCIARKPASPSDKAVTRVSAWTPRARKVCAIVAAPAVLPWRTKANRVGASLALRTCPTTTSNVRAGRGCRSRT